MFTWLSKEGGEYWVASGVAFSHEPPATAWALGMGIGHGHGILISFALASLDSGCG
jgi:hypothetical protein